MTEKNETKRALAELTKLLYDGAVITHEHCEKICDIMGHTYELKVAITDYPRMNIVPKLPSGWEPCGKQEAEYYFNTNSRRYVKATGRTINSDVFCIKQTINIDLGRQPPELKYFAIDCRDNRWHGYTNEPTSGLNKWRQDGLYRALLKSEEPTNYHGSARDSLLVRPETLNED